VKLGVTVATSPDVHTLTQKADDGPASNTTYAEVYFVWPPYGTEQAIIFLPCGFFFFYLSSFFLA